MSPHALDHVALWVADRHALAEFLCDHVGMHEIDKTDRFTLVGADARRGKLTLFEASGPRDRGALERVVLRVADLDGALEQLPDGVSVERPEPELALFDAPEGLSLGLARANGRSVDYDIDHVVLRVEDPQRTSEQLIELGFKREDERLVVADKHLQLQGGGASEGERPLLNHIALLVDSANEHEQEARQRGLEVDDVVDAANTLAVFVWGPDRIRFEYVEHKPGFSLV